MLLNHSYNKIKFLFLILCVLPLFACLGEDALTENQLLIETQAGESHRFNLELAITQEQQIQGLMNRTELAEDSGMLFYFNEESERAFWMKNTLIPLDIIFIKADGTIHHIHENAIPHDLTRIISNGAVGSVLEVNGGLASKLNIRKGDKVKSPLF